MHGEHRIPRLTRPLPSVPKDEYLADLYHFSTKEDSYANYFTHVSPWFSSSRLKLGWMPWGSTAGDLREMAGVCSGDAGKVSTSLTGPGGWPLSPQLLEIQADYHRKSLTSLDTALAELRDNHSQAGGDMNEPASPLTLQC